MRQLRTKKLGRQMAEKRNVKTSLSKTENRKVLRRNAENGKAKPEKTE